MSAVPCGRVMGHGSPCTEGYLCDSCQEITKLKSKLEWITTELEALELYDADDVDEMSDSTDGCKWIEDFMILRILNKLEKDND